MKECSPKCRDVAESGIETLTEFLPENTQEVRRDFSNIAQSGLCWCQCLAVLCLSYRAGGRPGEVESCQVTLIGMPGGGDYAYHKPPIRDHRDCIHCGERMIHREGCPSIGKN